MLSYESSDVYKESYAPKTCLATQSPSRKSDADSKIIKTPQTPEALVGTPFEGQRPARPRINFFFKCENYQRTGSFKIRGAFHALSRLSEEELAKGVVTHSSGKAASHG